jgi:hypothetical protein
VKGNLILFSAGLVLTTATQLRLNAYPVGLGEGLLLGWICISWIDIIGRKNIRVPVDLRPFLLFFAFVVALLLVSLLYQTARVGNLVPGALRDVAAYAFLAALVLTFCCRRPSRAFILQSLKFITIGLVLLTGSLLILSKFVPVLGPIALHNGARFLALAANPNQVGVALTPIPFLCLFFLRQATTISGRVAYACSLALALWVGIETVSEALQLAWAVGAVLLFIVVVMTKIFGRMHPLLTVWNVVAPPAAAILILLLTAFGQSMVEGVESADEGGFRPIAWKQAVAAVFESPLIGQGPGQKALGYSYHVITEVHNSYLDLALTAGLLGVGAAIWLTVSLLLRPSLVARPVLWSAFMAMQCFILFHYVFRHPLFWFYLMLMTSLAYKDQTARLGTRGSAVLRQAQIDPKQA